MLFASNENDQIILKKIFFIRSKLSPQTMRDLVLTAKRYNAQSALENGIVVKICDPSKLFEEGLKWAEQLSTFGSDRANFKKLKEEMNKVAIDACFNKGLAPGVRVRIWINY